MVRRLKRFWFLFLFFMKTASDEYTLLELLANETCFLEFSYKFTVSLVENATL